MPTRAFGIRKAIGPAESRSWQASVDVAARLVAPGIGNPRLGGSLAPRGSRRCVNGAIGSGAGNPQRDHQSTTFGRGSHSAAEQFSVSARFPLALSESRPLPNFRLSEFAPR
jgi:hypothetical protein